MIFIGDRYTAGMTNGSRTADGRAGLYAEGQAFAFPYLLSTQVSNVLIDEDKNPVAYHQHIASESGSGYFELEQVTFRECDGEVVSESITNRPSNPDWANEFPTLPTLNNFGIPFLKVADLFDQDKLTENFFYNRMIPQGEMVDQYPELYETRTPTFVTLFLGVEDILAYAMNGGTLFSPNMTELETFKTNYGRLMDSIEVHAAEGFLGVVVNIPDVTDFPYFASIDPVLAQTEDCRQSGSTIFYRKDMNTNDVFVADENVRLMLSLQGRLGQENALGPAYGLTTDNPIPDQFVLDEEELMAITKQIEAYNITLDSLVNAKRGEGNEPRWILVDVNQKFAQLKFGLNEGGLQVDNSHLSGGVFSLDGLTFTPRGTALFSNAIIESLNKKSLRKVRIPTFNITNFPGVVFP